MKVLVTGGAGFIGSHFVKLILKKRPGWSVVTLDKLAYAGSLGNLRDVLRHPRHRFIKGDVARAADVEKGIRGCGAVVHLAAETHVDRAIQDSAPFIHTNVQGTHVLLEAALRHRVKRYVQVSTDEVYGEKLKGHSLEIDILKPSNPYSASKAAGDHLALSYFRTFGLPVVVTRSTNNYGPYQYPEKFIPLFVTNALAGKPLPLYGDGRNVRDWLYVADNVEAILRVLEKGKPGEIYNVGARMEEENIKVARRIRSLVSKIAKTPVGHIRIQLVTDRLGHDRRYSLDFSKIKKKLHWRPRVSFDQGLRKTVEWYAERAR